MDFRKLTSDDALRSEFFERVDEIAAIPRAAIGLEGLEGGINSNTLKVAAESMTEGLWDSSDPGLEAIILRFFRPTYLIRQGSFQLPDSLEPESTQIASKLEAARSKIDRIIPGVGRVDLRNHLLDWVGTGWMVAPQTVVTNRHVAEHFARPSDNGFAFKLDQHGRRTTAYLDWRAEYRQPEESRFRVENVLHIEPETGPDVALLHIAANGESGEDPPTEVSLMSTQQASTLGAGSWICAIGYPAYDSRHDFGDQQRIFDGIYNYKRLAPGQITAFSSNEEIQHDATTLRGSSGSAIVDLASGKAIGLHFGGTQGDRNYAVHISQVNRILDTVG